MLRKLLCLAAAGVVGTFALACEESDDPTAPEVPPPTTVQEPAQLAMPAEPGPIDSDPSAWVAPADRSFLAIAGREIVVDDDGAECPDADHTTIQDAVDAAAAQSGKQNIQVCAGSYPENVSIGPNNPLALNGDGTGATVVTGSAGSSDPIIDIDMSDRVDIESLTVDGESNRSGSVAYGVRYYDTDGRVTDVEVLNIRNASGSTQGIGIGVLAGDGGPPGAKVKIEQSLIDNYTRVGILYDGEGAVGDVKDTDVVGPVDPREWAPNGIQVSREANARLFGNFIDNNPSPNPPGGAGSGIILFCADATHVKDNHVTRADLGISFVDNQEGLAEKNLVEDGDFDGISLQFLGLRFGDIGCGPSGTPASDNVVRNNTIVDMGDDGISFANFDEANDADSPSDNAVEKNEISGSGDAGVSVGHGERNVFQRNRSADSADEGFFVDDDTADNVFEKNVATGSGVFSCEDQSSGSGTAGTANTWTKNSGEQVDEPDGICP